MKKRFSLNAGFTLFWSVVGLLNYFIFKNELLFAVAYVWIFLHSIVLLSDTKLAKFVPTKDLFFRFYPEG